MSLSIVINTADVRVRLVARHSEALSEKTFTTTEKNVSAETWPNLALSHDLMSLQCDGNFKGRGAKRGISFPLISTLLGSCDTVDGFEMIVWTSFGHRQMDH